MNRLEAMELAQKSEHCLRPAEAFSLIGNEIRVTILEALWHADEPPVGFTTLYEHAGADNTAQFNYHLGQLTGHFVRKTDDGYELRTAGESVVQAAVEGSFNAHPDLDPIDTGDDCTQCEATLVATYSDEKLAIGCPTCGRTHGQYSFPPGGLIGRTEAETLSAFNQRVRHLHSLARDGVCPECSGQMRTEIVRGENCCLDADLRTEYTCLQCRHILCSTIGLALLDQPPVVSFYRDHGLDLQTMSYWQLNWCVSDDCTTVESADPWRIEVSITENGDTLTASLDEGLSIVTTYVSEGDASNQNFKKA
ncbi:ArsR family transcriptional regulator [Salinigranum rubrum]|uniref:ArsR family transcriptional regulator n=1 Tax=Salinigranum rubrum TaxID=755307 RepID=A0A2I8VHI8_9EURY|nr:ArsR family transcriptional regulator [Salinigranum rubrum]AUV81403.1 ArsR family transcriptional regulator [Salinigranum rubrum]